MVLVCVSKKKKNPASTQGPYMVLLSYTLKWYHISILKESTVLFKDSF